MPMFTPQCTLPLSARQYADTVLREHDLKGLEELLRHAPALIYHEIQDTREGMMEKNWAPFPLACIRHGFAAGLELAIEHGLDPNIEFDAKLPAYTNTGVQSLMHYAISDIAHDAVRILLKHGADLSRKDYAGDAALGYAWWRAILGITTTRAMDRMSIVETLLDAKAPWLCDSPQRRAAVTSLARTPIRDREVAAIRLRILEKGCRAGWDLTATNDALDHMGRVIHTYGPIEAALQGGGKDALLTLIRCGADPTGSVTLSFIRGDLPSNWVHTDCNTWEPEVQAALMAFRLSVVDSAGPVASQQRPRALIL